MPPVTVTVAVPSLPIQVEGVKVELKVKEDDDEQKAYIGNAETKPSPQAKTSPAIPIIASYAAAALAPMM